jgi:hypothetical protein
LREPDFAHQVGVTRIGAEEIEEGFNSEIYKLGGAIPISFPWRHRGRLEKRGCGLACRKIHAASARFGQTSPKRRDQ